MLPPYVTVENKYETGQFSACQKLDMSESNKRDLELPTAKHKVAMDAAFINGPSTKPATLFSHADLTDSLKAKILRLSTQEQLHSGQIAPAIGCSVATVLKVLQAFKSTTDAAKATAKAKSLSIVERMADEATTSHRPNVRAAELVLRVADLVGPDANQQQAVQVIVNMPGSGRKLPATDSSDSDDPPRGDVADAEVVDTL